jgi:hypothetical protein
MVLGWPADHPLILTLSNLIETANLLGGSDNIKVALAEYDLIYWSNFNKIL